MEYRGIDVSKHQGKIDMSEVKKSGIDFLIARIGYGMYENQKDQQFENNYKEAIKHNIPIGVYLYSYALNKDDAYKEAEMVLKWLNKRKLNLPVYYDIEDKSQANLSKELLTEMCEVFCTKIEKAGYWAGVYANKYWLNSHLNHEVLEKKYTIWVAQYNTSNTYKGKYDMWQYTSSGKVNGIKTNVDMDILYRNIFTNINKQETVDVSDYSGNSIVDALKSRNIDSSFDNRAKLYKENGFTDKYVGSSEQNLNLLKKMGFKKDNYYKCNYNGFSLVDALKSIGVDSSFDNREKIALRNGITNYKGSYFQNSNLLNLLKKGLLKI